jgi:hypothetical protein
MVGLRFDRDSRYTVDIFFLFRIPFFCCFTVEFQKCKVIIAREAS